MKWIVPIFISMTLLFSGCARYRLDAQVRELCAKDGGIRVYETVELPPEKFNRWGQINFYDPTGGENALGDEYLFIKEIHYYIKGNYEEPAMWKYSVQIFRSSDGNMLGESVGYARRGGDLPGPWHPSAFSCPYEHGPENLLNKIFIKTNSSERIDEHY